MIGAFQAELPVAKGLIDERAVVRLGAVRVYVRLEIAARHAHARDRDLALDLLGAVHLDQGVQDGLVVPWHDCRPEADGRCLLRSYKTSGPLRERNRGPRSITRNRSRSAATMPAATA